MTPKKEKTMKTNEQIMKEFQKKFSPYQKAFFSDTMLHEKEFVEVRSFLEEKLTAKDAECEKAREAKLPMGVSQWREHGKRYEYWEYFEEEIREEERNRMNKIITNWLRKYADTPLDERKSVWKSVVEIRKLIKKP